MEAKERLNQLYNYFDTNASKIELLIREKDSNTKFSRQSLYNIESGKTKSISFKLASEIIKAFDGLNIEWLLTGKGNMILPNYKGAVSINQNKSNPVQISNGKSKNSNEGKVLNNDDVVKIKTFIIPIKGFAGLKNAFYDDQYITENFDETTTDVPHYLYSPISYRIQSTGNSMPKSIPDGSWVTGVPVPEMMWLTYKFKQDKTYILFHPYRGILFKHVKNLSEYEIMLCSENEDKEEYPDEKFKINEFRKILLAIKVERFI